MIYMYPAFILKFFYSPWNKAMKNRKLQIGPTLSKHSIQHGLGTHHLITLDELEKYYIHFANSTIDLRTIRNIKFYFQIYVFLTINTSKKNIWKLSIQTKVNSALKIIVLLELSHRYQADKIFPKMKNKPFFL